MLMDKPVISVCACVCLQWIAWTPCAQVAVCVCAVSVCVRQAGEVRPVRRHFLPVKNNVQVMERTKPRQGGVCVNRDGAVTTAPWVSISQNTQLVPFILSFVIIVLKVLFHHLVMRLSLRSF